MTAPRCEQIGLTQFTDYAAGDLPEAEAAAVEEHLFSCTDCAARAAEFDALLSGVRAAAVSAEVGGFVTDDLLNRLAREGVRIRSFVATPGAVIPCAVWDDDEMMVLRLRGDFGDVREVTMTQRVGGTEVLRASGQVLAGSHQEIVFATPAAWIRQLPVIDVEVQLTAVDAGTERTIGTYTLEHGGALER